MTEVDVSSENQTQDVGAVLGRILHHALHGDCIIGRSLPEESFFLDYIMARLGENFTVEGNRWNIFTKLFMSYCISTTITWIRELFSLCL